jgi:Ca2+:H+ antiporter
MPFAALLLPPPRWRPLLLCTALTLVPGLADQLVRLDEPASHLLRFALCGLGLLPLAVVLSQLVEQLVEQLGPRLGGLVSVVFGNVVELLVAINALNSGLYPLVVMSIAGSVVINCLPVLGLGIVIATRRTTALAIDPHNRDLHTQQLLMSAILLALPSVFYQQGLGAALQGSNRLDGFALYSTLVAVLALAYYVLAFVAQGQRQRLAGLVVDATAPTPRAGHHAPLSAVLAALALITVLVALISDRLVEALEAVVTGSHLNELFVGLFLLPLFGCLPEALVSIKAASRQQMQLLMTSTIESSLQLLLLVLPVLVLLGIPMGRYLHLSLPPVALAALGIAMVMLDRITDNREVNWYEGVQLLVLFGAMATGALLLISP